MKTSMVRQLSACCSTCEGNIITSIICRKAKPTYEKCLADAPRLNKTKGVCRTIIPYPESVREYGFTFTPMFDDKGQACAPVSARRHFGCSISLAIGRVSTMTKLNKKGQVTIPATIRRAMGLKPGDRVEFTALTDSTVRLDAMRTRLRPISHERAEKIMEERTRSASASEPDTNGKRRRPDND